MTRFIVGMAMLSLAGAASAQVWNEVGDAPARPSSQMTVGFGPLTSINGHANRDAAGAIDVDFYMIRLNVGASWSASTVGGAGWDTMLALYALDGATLITANDDSVGLQSTIGGVGDGNCFLLGITSYPDFGWDDTGSNGTSPYTIFLDGASYCEVPAPGAAALLGLGGLLVTRRRR